MKIEFRKVPLTTSEFEIDSDSVKFSGTFSKISQKLAKVSANITGQTVTQCCRCGKDITLNLDEKVDLLISDGVYSPSEDEDRIIVEVEDHIINFDEILNSEIESLKSEYYICDECDSSDSLIEKEY